MNSTNLCDDLTLIVKIFITFKSDSRTGKREIDILFGASQADQETDRYYGIIEFCVFGTRSNSFIHLSTKLGRCYKLKLYLFPTCLPITSIWFAD